MSETSETSETTEMTETGATGATGAASPASATGAASAANPTGALLEVHGLRSGYRQGTVLHGVDLGVARGRILGLLGRNGVGKTTLVMTIMGLLRPSRGTVRLAGEDLAGRRPDEIARAGVGLVPQGRRIWPTLTVHEHLELAGRHARRTGRARRPDEMYQLLPRLAERRRQLAGQLSGGEQQMLAIARALLTDPVVVLLDEPSEGLAPLLVDQIGAMIQAMARTGVGVLLVEQDLHLAFGVADEIAVMAKGAIVHRSDTAAFRRDAATARRLLGIEA
jgi:branched-chain amino acid transport system ATP-binding protein